MPYGYIRNGYINCHGCGRLFHAERELEDYDDHSCEDGDFSDYDYAHPCER